MLIDDISAAETFNEKKVDECVRFILELENLKVIINLHEYNNGRLGKYDVFWEIAAQFLAEKVANAVTTVDKCRYDTIMHLTTTISVNDLLH